MKKLIPILFTFIIISTMIGCAPSVEPIHMNITTIEIYKIFVEADLPVGEYIDYDKNTDPNGYLGQSGQYIAKLNFAIDSIPQYTDTPKGGSIEIFSNSKDAQARKEYIDSIGATSPAFAEHSAIVLDVVLIRIDNQISEEEAQRYFDLFKI